MSNKANCRDCGKRVSDRKICQLGRGCRVNKSWNNPLNGNPVRTAKAQAEPTKRRLHIGILLDSSGSMDGYKKAAINYFNQQIETIKLNASRDKISTYVSFYTFGKGRGTVNVESFNQWYENAPMLTDYNYTPQGQTPLVDCVVKAIDDLSTFDKSTDDSFLILTLTDGQENYSSISGRERITKLIQDKQSSDRWTFAFSGPASAKNELLNYGILAGNFTSWELTTAGLDHNTRVVSRGLSSYMVAAAAAPSGSSYKSSNFFTTNLTNVSDQQIKGLANLNNQFRRFVIQDSDCTGKDASGRRSVEISEFVQKYNLIFQLARGFYQLTKTEDIQDHKELVILNTQTGEIYGGREAKSLLGLPNGGTIKVKPGQHAHYKIFVQSTSTNRKLIAGTEFLYRLS